MSNQMNGPGSLYARNLNIVKGYFKKPLTLFVGLAYLASFVITIMLNSRAAEVASSIADMLAVEGTENVTSSSGGIIVGYIISAVVIACILLVYVTSQSSSPKSSPAPFVAVLHVLSVITLIALAISTVAIVVFLAMFIAMGPNAFSAALESANEQTPGLIQGDVALLASAYRLTIIIVMVLLAVFCALGLVMINAQTKFLKSVKRSCHEPLLMRKGAKTYSTFAMVFACIELVGYVIGFLLVSDTANTISAETGLNLIFGLDPLTIAAFIIGPLQLILVSLLASGYDKYAMENEDYASTAAPSMRRAEVNPIATYKADTRKSEHAVSQSQPYLYGEEENTNKKSSYIPLELQQDDYIEPQYDPQFDPQYNQNPYGAAPMQFDPFSHPQDAFMGGNPYPQQPMDPNNPYNNGMM